MMHRSAPATIGTTRYELKEVIGVGGMGTVYRAVDRLSGHHIALKRVTLAPMAIGANEHALDDDSHANLVALAHEFRTLAALRHPHIISVLDYGFDAERHPFFTMELVADAQPLLSAGQDRPIEWRVALLLQALEALAYLHRRGILHHDLKPANILVAEGRVRLLDFGLAVIVDQQREDELFGTFQYLAPEIFAGRPYTQAADLYSMGVLAYELLVGRHPFVAETARAFLQVVREREPDLAPLALQPALATIVGRMMAKEPADRPESAQAAIMALREAIAHAQPPDTAIRESYLQSATLVGRADELAKLRGALGRTLDGAGELWLVGGESGVGKSRLLDELRAEALVAGALVAVGQAADGRGQPYQAWREPLRRLVLEVTLDELEAGVLKALVPDLALLLGRPVAAADLTGEAGRLRLHATVIELLRRVPRPLLLILEDLQWAHESLLLLHDAAQGLANAPIMFVGSYRSDEWHAGDMLAGAQQILLERLSAATIGDLSVAMLGPAGREAAVLDLLQRESEGNTFFLIEVVRALAEEAGGLAQVGALSLPRSIFAGGMRQILLRRLARFPAWGQPLLSYAAVAGRRIDPAVLGRLAEPGLDMDRWLRAGADAAVLEIADEQWRFTHDKLREALLADLGMDDRAPLHRQVAEAIEAAYPGERERQAYAEVLLEHWRKGGAHDRAIGYALILVDWKNHYSAEYAAAAALLELVDADAVGADARLSVAWLREPLRQALAVAGPAAHSPLGAPPDAPAALALIRRWLAGPPERPL